VESVPPPQNIDGEQKEVILHNLPRYVRSEKPDELRCTAVKNDGSRCTLSRKLPTAFCHHHREMVGRNGVNSEAGSDS
jgi:hypothetical protein